MNGKNYLTVSIPVQIGDADAAVETRIRIGWNKFRQLVPLLTIDSEREIVQQLCAKQYVAWK